MLVEKIKKELIKQRNSKFKGNVYHYFQINFAYNSNKIEGGHLTLKVIMIKMNKILKRNIIDEDNHRYMEGLKLFIIKLV